MQASSSVNARGNAFLRVAKSYALALVVVGAAISIKLWLAATVGREAPFLLLLGAVSVSTWLGGRGPGLLAVLLTTVALSSLFLPTYYGHRTEWLGLHAAAFALEGLLVASLTSYILAARRRAERLATRMSDMYRTSAALARSRTVREVAKAIATEGLESLQAASVTTYVSKGASGKLRAAAFAPPEAEPADALVTAGGDMPAAVTLRTEGIVYAENDEAKLWAGMVASSGCVGVLELQLAQGQTLTPDDRAFVLRLAQDGAFALERALQHDSAQRARVDAEEANRAKDEFLGVVSHELRSPLASIIGWSRMLRLCPSLDQGARERALDVIERNARAQERLVADVLDISRIAACKLRLDLRAVDLTRIAESSVEDLQHDADQRGVALTMSALGPLTVRGDPERLRQVVTNLISNALKFTHRGGHVSVAIETGRGALLLRVRDDGVGISEAELPHVFEPFRRGSTSSGVGGAGLGLAIVKSLVQEHGGSVRIESEGPGRGTTATVCLRPWDEETSGVRHPSQSADHSSRQARPSGTIVATTRAPQTGASS